MTQTSLNDLLDQAWALHGAIHAAMTAIKNDGPIQPDEWHDLAIAFDGAGITANQLYRMIKRQQDAAAPVPAMVHCQADTDIIHAAGSCPFGKTSEPVPYVLSDSQ